LTPPWATGVILGKQMPEEREIRGALCSSCSETCSIPAAVGTCGGRKMEGDETKKRTQ